ncbi:MAG: carboxymuconolactone decarboxylase family protein [Elusimicrobia bacterium]|nr:carboxymuconolactone decarboxylase family protein [Elusimicrobiota bacterium]MDE2313844.1 carboxymuconolactone decarboxylase family protein [Elusimicrobiota bacterium]
MTQAALQDNPEAVLDGIKKKLGFVPNIYKEMIKSPAAFEVYVGGTQALERRGILKPVERQAAMLAVSASNKCDYCASAHSLLAKASGMAEEDTAAVRSGGEPRDARLGALVRAVRLILDKRGFLDEENLRRLEKDGIARPQLYELIAIVGLKTISNYLNHINHTEIDPQFKG